MRFTWSIAGLTILAVAPTRFLPAENPVMFNYQGYIKVKGIPYDGTGEFKFAILSSSGEATLWSNDMWSVAGSEPDCPVTLPVVDGVFQVLIGDTSIGMSPINRIIFNQGQPRLRMWFSDGEHGFEHMTPDTVLNNIELLGSRTDTTDFTLFVSGAAGDDENDGLTTQTAKRTIGGAVKTLPSRIRCNITIDVADGIYREQVLLFGITAEEGKFVTFVGDENWSPNSPEPPTVRVTGTDVDTTITTPVAAREYGFIARLCNGIQIKGFRVDYTNRSGILAAQSTVLLEGCQANYNGPAGGIAFTTAAYGQIKDCVADYNEKFGFLAANYSGPLTAGTVIARHNASAGFMVGKGGRVSFHGTANLSYNNRYGIVVSEGAQVYFGYDDYAGTIANNAEYGMVVQFDSFTLNHTRNTFSSNGTNTRNGDGGTLYTAIGVGGL